MTGSVTAALIVAGILGLSFAQTRGIAIAAIAALTFIYPMALLAVLAGVAIAIYLRFLRK